MCKNHFDNISFKILCGGLLTTYCLRTGGFRELSEHFLKYMFKQYGRFREAGGGFMRKREQI